MSGWGRTIAGSLPLLTAWLLADAAAAGQLTAGYEVRWAGIAVGRVETSLGGEGAAYRLVWQGRTVGLAETMFPFASAGSSEGRREQGRVVSERFTGESRSGDRSSHWRVTFGADGRAGRIELSPDTGAEREPVPAALQAGPDPLALLLQAIEQAAPGLSASGTGFDGRRVTRYELSCDDTPVPVDADRAELACTIEGRLLAGAARGSAQAASGWRREPIRAWLRTGLRPGGWWPVRIEVPARIGSVEVRLVELQGRPHIEG